MSAKLKCSHCGTEISTLNMAWSWKQFLIVIPIMLLGFLPLMGMTFFKGDIEKDLVISDVQQRPVDGKLEILAVVTNQGRLDWSSVTIEAEFFDASGAFVDEAEEYLRGDILGGAREHVKISIENPREEMTAAATKMVVKVSGGHTSPF